MTALAPTARWTEMSAEEKREARFRAWLSADGVEFVSPEAEAAYKARVTRIKDAIELEKTPDRVPIYIFGTFMPAHLYGVSPHTVMYDAEVARATYLRFVREYDPDHYLSPAGVGSGPLFDALDYKQYAWPGHGVSTESGYQYVEGEYMTEEEYEALIDDPSDFFARRFLPRIFGALAGLCNLPPFTDPWEVVLVAPYMAPFGTPEVQGALRALVDAGNAAMAWQQSAAAFDLEARRLGYPRPSGGVTKAPFDLIADTLRGTRSMMVDLYRRSDLVVKAVERVTPLAIKQGVRGANLSDAPIVVLPLHKGADGFMSDAQFRELYWPSLKEVVLGLVDEGCVPCLFCEGGYNSRLDYLRELPRGSCLCLFDRTEMAAAKQAIGDTVCIAGNVPSGLILTGTAEEVEAYCRDLIDVAAPGGGFIMSCGTAMYEGRADTVHAMIDFTKEYGVYR